jgi:hypothetical protein
MTTATAPPRESPRLILARIELVRLLRHPAFVGFAALTVLLQVIGYIELASDRSNFLYDMVANGPPFWVPAAVGIAIAAGLAATRARRDDVDELMDTAPVLRSARVEAVMLAVLGVGALSAAAVVAFVTVTGGWNGFPVLLEPGRTVWVDYPQGTELASTDVTPSIFELAAGPAALVTWGLLGVATARLLGSRVLVLAMPLIGFIQLFIVTWIPATPTRWFWPFTHSAQQVGWIELAEDGTGTAIAGGFNIAAAGWHLLYLLGVGAVLVAAARWHRSAAPCATMVTIVGILIAVSAGAAQLSAYTPDLPS